MRLLGIDYGTKRVGLAISDEEGRVAFPYGVFPNNAKLIPTIADIAQNELVSEIVIGESKNLTGEENKLMQEIRTFTARLHTAVGAIPVYFEPEYYTSAQARRPPARTRDGKQHSAAPVDAAAATIILQSFIDGR